MHYLQLVHPLLQAVLGLGLLPHQDDVPRGVVDGDVRQVEASAHELLQLVHPRGAQEHQGAGLGHVDHLTLQLHHLAERTNGEGEQLRKLGLLCSLEKYTEPQEFLIRASLTTMDVTWRSPGPFHGM